MSLNGVFQSIFGSGFLSDILSEILLNPDQDSFHNSRKLAQIRTVFYVIINPEERK